MTRKKTNTPVAKAPAAEPTPHTKAANLRATKRLVAKVEAGEERIMLNLRRTDAKSTVREGLDGMSDQMLNMRLADALGTTSGEFVDGMIVNLLTYFNAPTVHRDRRELNAALAVLDGAKPENEVEAMLLAQMVVTNDAAMRCLSQITNGMSAETFGNLGVKLLRTFTAQTEALAKLRRKGEQTVRVVHVHPGAQAVVGDVHKGDVHNHAPGGGAEVEIEEPQYGSGGTAPAAQGRKALPGPDAAQDGVPISGDAERPMQDPRRPVTRRRARKPERS